jgi:hypothetical protein
LCCPHAFSLLHVAPQARPPPPFSLLHAVPLSQTPPPIAPSYRDRFKKRRASPSPPFLPLISFLPSRLEKTPTPTSSTSCLRRLTEAPPNTSDLAATPPPLPSFGEHPTRHCFFSVGTSPHPPLSAPVPHDSPEPPPTVGSHRHPRTLLLISASAASSVPRRSGEP